MALFSEGMSYFRENNYLQAISIFEDGLSDALWTLDQKIDAYQNLLRIYDLLKDANKWESTKWKFAQFLISQKMYGQALIHFEEIYRQKTYSDYGEVVYNLWLCLSNEGEVYRAHQFAHQLLDFYQLTKRSMLGLNFIKELIVTNFPHEIADYYQVSFLIKSGQRKELAQFIERKFISQNLREIRDDSYLDKTIKSIEHELKNWQNAPGLAKFKLMIKANSLDGVVDLKDHPTILAAKDFIKILYQYLIYFPNEQIPVLQLLLYCQKFQRGHLLEHIAKWYEYHKSSLGALIKQNFDELFKKLGTVYISAKDIVVPERYDLGTDLFFQALPSSDTKREKVRRIERDIIFLKQRGENGKVEKLIQTLKEIDEDNTLVSEEEQKVDVTKIKDWTMVTTTSKLGKIGEGIRKYLFDGLKDNVIWRDESFQRNEEYFKRYIEHLSKDEIFPFYKDLVEVFRSLGMFAVSLKILDKVQEWFGETVQLQQMLDHAYLRISLLIDNDDLHDGLATVEDLLKNWPLNDDERVCFLYLTGEIFLKMGKKKKALNVYKRVKKMNPKYRLVTLRIKEIETR
jgi:tetratricopeptide (TPR) repeat protein